MKKLILILLLLPTIGFSATQYTNVCFSIGIDTAWIYVYRTHSLTPLAGYNPSVVTGTFPQAKSIATQDTAQYSYFTFVHWQGDADGSYYSGPNGYIPATVYNVTATASLSGTGGDPFYVYVYDTATSLGVPGIYAYLYTLGGNKTYTATTDINGRATFGLTVGDSMKMFANIVGYSFRAWDTAYVSAAGVSDTIYGSTINVGTPSSADVCRVYTYAFDNNGTLIEGAKLTATLVGNNIMDTCQGAIIVKPYVEAFSNSSGYVYLDLIKSKCLLGDRYYLIQMEFNEAPRNKYQGAVPDSNSYWIWRR